MAISVVQQQSQTQSAALNAEITFAVAPTEGNWILAALRINEPASGVFTVTPPTGFVQDVLQPGNRYCSIFSKQAGAGESATVTFVTTSAAVKALHCWEISGLAAVPLDKTAVGSASAVNSVACGDTGVLAQGDEVAVCLCSLGGNSNDTWTVDSGFTLDGVDAGTQGNYAHKITTVTDALNPTFAWVTNRASGACIATYKGAAAGGPVALDGSLAAIGGATGALSMARPLAGAASAVGVVDGALAVSRPLSGSLAAVGAMAGTLTAARPLNGAVAALGGLDGAVTVARSLTGQVAAIAGFTGDLTVTGASQPDPNPLHAGTFHESVISAFIEARTVTYLEQAPPHFRELGPPMFGETL